MNEITPIRLVEPVIYGVVKIEWADGFAAVVDLRPVLAEAEIFTFLRQAPDRFKSVQLAPYGHYIFWVDDQGDEIEFGANSLRHRAQRQAEILRLAS